jgi:hypothetical protein
MQAPGIKVIIDKLERFILSIIQSLSNIQEKDGNITGLG